MSDYTVPPHIKKESTPERPEGLQLKRIARIHTDFPTKFGIPRQSGLVEECKGIIQMEPEYRNPHAFRGLEGYSHLWLIWEFSEAVRDGWSPTVLPPRLGGKTRMGVFATRSPFRPNALGLSSVRLEKIQLESDQGPLLYVAGVDLMDGTPIYDIKPYCAFTDSHPDALGGFTARTHDYSLQVDFPEELLLRIPEEKRPAILALLAQDPRPSYQRDPDRVYGMEFDRFDVRFLADPEKGILTVCDVVQVR